MSNAIPGWTAGTFVDNSSTVPVEAAFLNGVVKHLDGQAAGRDTGLQGYWNMDSLPDYPDGVSPTYFQDAWATVDGWFGTNTTVSAPGGGLLRSVATASGYNTRKVLSLPAGTYTIRARIRRTLGSIGTYKIYTVDSVGGTILRNPAFSFASTGYEIIDITATLAGTWTEIGINGSISNVGDTIEIDWIYIGDGSYSTPLLDNSGNGNHGTVYGCTPTEGVSGRALIGDGVNDYIAMGDVGKITGALSLSIWAKANASITTGTLGMFGKYRTTGNQRQYMLDLLLGKARFVVSSDGLATTQVADTGAVISTSVFEHFVAVYVPSTGLYLYRNGVLVASNTTSIPASLYNSTSSLELLRDIGGTLYTGITIDSPRIYNRALSADEVMGLYLNPGGADAAKEAVTAVPNSRVVRTPEGGISFRNATASSNAEVLDDYEEGTWTPGISFGGGTTGVTYSIQAGAYTKIGNRVFFTADVTLSAKGSSTGAALITGLPLTSANNSANICPVSLYPNSITYTGMALARIGASASTLTLVNVTEGGILTALTDANFTATSAMFISGHYYV